MKCLPPEPCVHYGDRVLKGTINVTRQTGSTVTMVLDIRQKSNNDEFMVFTANGIDVSDAGNGNLSFRYEGEQIGTLKGNKLVINGEDDSNVRFTIGATVFGGRVTATKRLWTESP